MIKIIQKFKDNKNGFLLLFAVTLAALLFSIAIGVVNIALKEVKFGTNALETNKAFFAADAGAECAMSYDKSSPGQNKLPRGGPASAITCAGSTSITPTYTASGSGGIYTFTVIGLGNGITTTGIGCAIVTVDKSVSLATKITSKGYNNGGGGTPPNVTCTPGSNTIERQIEVNY